MERIKQALERARAERAQQPTPISNERVAPVPTITPVEQVKYSQTRNIEVSRPELRDKRVAMFAGVSGSIGHVILGQEFFRAQHIQVRVFEVRDVSCDDTGCFGSPCRAMLYGVLKI